MWTGFSNLTVSSTVTEAQLIKDFCSDSGLPPPRYHQRTERGSSTVFYGIVKVEDDVFESK
jgi:hypothetical protein